MWVLFAQPDIRDCWKRMERINVWLITKRLSQFRLLDQYKDIKNMKQINITDHVKEEIKYA